MRNIKFRGKSNDEWVYGLLLKSDKDDRYKYLIQSDHEKCKRCGKELVKYFITNEKTIGQFTGLHDKTKKEIYEGDIVFIKGETKLLDIKGKVKYSNILAQFIITNTENIINEAEPLGDYEEEDIEVIGNEFDNPELLEKGEQ